MKRVLAIVRRFFGWGSISFLIFFFFMELKEKPVIGIIQSLYYLYFVLSPILYLLFAIISVIYFRKSGQFAPVFQEHSPVANFFKCLSTDLIAPFKNIGGFIGALINKESMGRGLLIARFIEMIIVIFFCGIGIFILI